MDCKNDDQLAVLTKYADNLKKMIKDENEKEDPDYAILMHLERNLENVLDIINE